MAKIFWGLFIVMLSLNAAAGKEYFRIGKPDAMSSEFRTFSNLADSRYYYQRSHLKGDASEKGRAFRDIDNLKDFYSKPIVFEIGKSSEKEFPFIHIIRGWDVKKQQFLLNLRLRKNFRKTFF